LDTLLLAAALATAVPGVFSVVDSKASLWLLEARAYRGLFPTDAGKEAAFFLAGSVGVQQLGRGALALWCALEGGAAARAAAKVEVAVAVLGAAQFVVLKPQARAPHPLELLQVLLALVLAIALLATGGGGGGGGGGSGSDRASGAGGEPSAAARATAARPAKSDAAKKKD
jgi:hypothetical protein